MKNITIKIIILTTAIIVAVGAVLYFVKTVVVPPNEVGQRNLHAEILDSSIGKFKESNKSKSFDDSLYLAVKNKISVFFSEGFISEVQKDVATANFVQAYVPIFKDECYNKFNATVWRESDHKKIESRIKDLRSLKVNYGKKKAIEGLLERDLHNIEVIILNYKEAKKAATKNSYSTISQAKSDIGRANEYVGMPYISNCKDLVAKLTNVKINIANSHYQYLTNQVYRLAEYRAYSKDSYSKLVSEVLAKIDSYVNMKSVYASGYRDVSTLKRKVGEYELEANDYFTRPEITINTNGYAWTSISSSHTEYNSYRSNSNYHTSNADSRMSFTIKGYSEFTFYIGSNAESTYDYVMVGAPNTIPTRSNYYVSTSGKQTKYIPVTYRNLNKSSSYTIYVVYTKDGSNNYGDDRGYVLIPKL